MNYKVFIIKTKINVLFDMLYREKPEYYRQMRIIDQPGIGGTVKYSFHEAKIICDEDEKIFLDILDVDKINS